jgi:FSR family fosmidomycin resistance protein-like MFS transporter
MSINGATLTMAGIALSILEGAGVIGALLSGTFSDKLGRKPVLLVVTLLSSGLMLIFLNLEGLWMNFILIPLGFSALSTGPIFLAQVQDHFPENRAVGNGLYLGASFLIRSLALFLIGVAGDAIGLNATFFWSAMISLLAIPAILALPKTPKPETHGRQPFRNQNPG